MLLRTQATHGDLIAAVPVSRGIGPSDFPATLTSPQLLFYLSTNTLWPRVIIPRHLHLFLGVHYAESLRLPSQMWAKNKKWVMGWTRGVIHYHLVTILDGMPNAIEYSSFHFTQSLSDALNKTAHTSPLHIFYVKPPNHILNLFPSCSFSFARFALDRIQCSPSPLLGFVPKLSEK